MESRFITSGIFAVLIGIILLVQANEPIGKYYFSVFFSILGIILLFKGIKG